MPVSVDRSLSPSRPRTSTPAGPSRGLGLAALVIILWVAFALRVAGLDRLPLWWDEGLNIFFARQDLAGLIRETLVTLDANPPIYRLTLSVWYMFAGPSPFSTRLLLVMVGVLTVALTWTVGRWLAGENVAILAAWFMAIAPLQIYYAREAKGYAFAAGSALLSVYVWGRKLGYLDPAVSCPGRARWWLIYVLSTIAAIGTHYYLGLVVLWQGLWVVGGVGVALARKRAARNQSLWRLARWCMAVTVVACTFVPWVWLVYRTTVASVEGISVGGSLDGWGYLGRVAAEFGAGQGAGGAAAWLAGAVLVFLVGLGSLAGGIHLFLITWLGVPLAAAYPIQSSYSFFSPRFLIFLGPACYLLAGRGVMALGRRLGKWAAAVLVAVMAVACLPGLARIYAGPIDEAEDARPAMSQLRAAAQPGDAILTTYVWQDGYLESYIPTVRFTGYRSSYDARTVAGMLKAIFDKHQRLWVYNYLADVHDRVNPLANWLNRNAALAFDGWYGNTQMALFIRAGDPPAVWPDGTAFEQGIELSHAPLAAFVRPGEGLPLDLRWQSAGPLDRAYKVFVHLRGPDQSLVAQSDGEPAGGFEPTDAWKPGRPALDRRALLVPRAVSPGTYTVYAGMYDPGSHTRLRVISPAGCDTADSACLGQIEVVRPALHSP